MEIEGKLILDLPMTEGIGKATGKPWRKKEWVIETVNTQYPRKVMFSAMNDRIDNMRLELGKVYAISVDLESREYNGRWYTDVRAYAAREAMIQQPQSVSQGFSQPSQGGFGSAPTVMGGFPEAPAMPASDSSDDLPF